MNQLVHFNKAKKELALATKIDEVKDIRDKAEALRAYSKQVGHSFEMQNHCAEIKVRAERRGGELLREQKERGERHTGHGDQKSVGHNDRPKLEDIGIDYNQSKRWQQIASIPEDDFEQHITEKKTKKEEITSIGLLNVAKKQNFKEKREQKLNKIIETNIDEITERFSIIYADPPWRYEHSETVSREIENQYPTMSLDKIKQLPINEISSNDCVLFLWATNPKLKEAMEVIEAWGFEYRTNMAWIKDKIGMGYYARQKHELLLIAKKGNLPVPLPGNRPESAINAKREKHSKKPDIFYELIERMYPELSKIELFARQKKEGWEFWGNESIISRTH